jgi:hypothetical protein
MVVCDVKGQSVNIPLLPQEADVELVLLQLFAGERHDLVEGPLQEMIPPDQQPAGDQTFITVFLAPLLLNSYYPDMNSQLCVQ